MIEHVTCYFILTERYNHERERGRAWAAVIITTEGELLREGLLKVTSEPLSNLTSRLAPDCAQQLRDQGAREVTLYTSLPSNVCKNWNRGSLQFKSAQNSHPQMVKARKIAQKLLQQHGFGLSY